MKKNIVFYITSKNQIIISINQSSSSYPEGHQGDFFSSILAFAILICNSLVALCPSTEISSVFFCWYVTCAFSNVSWRKKSKKKNNQSRKKNIKKLTTTQKRTLADSSLYLKISSLIWAPESWSTWARVCIRLTALIPNAAFRPIPQEKKLYQFHSKKLIEPKKKNIHNFLALKFFFKFGRRSAGAPAVSFT